MIVKMELCFSESELARMQALCNADAAFLGVDEAYSVEAFVAASALLRLEDWELRQEIAKTAPKTNATTEQQAAR